MRYTEKMRAALTELELPPSAEILDIIEDADAEIAALKAKVEAAEGLYDRLALTDMQLVEHDWDQDIPVTVSLNESALQAARKAGLGGDES